MRKRIALLGSTGSIGKNVIDVVAAMGDDFRLTSLAAHRNTDSLARQIRELRPDRAVIFDESLLPELKKKAGAVKTEISAGGDALESLARDAEVDMVFQAMSGAAGMPISLAAVESGHTLALANKESLVMAGHVLMPLAREKNARIIPVDSEHSAIMQLLEGSAPSDVRRVIITASGGPFYDRTLEDLEAISPDEALNHPTWKMGQRITVDSATLMNKALEIIEAKWLFDLAPSQIEVVIHRQSVVHSIVEFRDNSMYAQMSVPDMRLPIQHALTYPERTPGRIERLNLADVASLTFEKPDTARFPALKMGFHVVEEEGISGAVLNAADEAAVAAFLDGKMSFARIIPVVKQVLSKHRSIPKAGIEQILAADKWAREEVRKCLLTG